MDSKYTRKAHFKKVLQNLIMRMREPIINFSFLGDLKTFLLSSEMFYLGDAA